MYSAANGLHSTKPHLEETDGEEEAGYSVVSHQATQVLNGVMSLAQHLDVFKYKVFEYYWSIQVFIVKYNY